MAKTIISTNFDPSQITLRDFMELYVEKRGIKRDNFFSGFSDAVFQPYMDRPAIEFFESAREEGNPLQRFFDDQAAKGVGPGGAEKAYSNAKNLEDNVIHQLKRLKRMGEYADDTNGFPRLTDTVVKPAKGAPRSKKFKINPERLGLLKVKLIEHARENPKDVPIVRALLVQMYTGFRPKEIIQMPMNGTIKEAAEGSVSKGLFLPAGITKMDEAFAVPLTPHVESALNASIDSNSSRFVDRSIPDRMFLMDNGNPIPEGALSRVLKQIEVPGILEDAVTGEPINFLTAAYDLRRAHATGVNQLGYSVEVGAKMKGRAIKAATAGDEPRYVATGFRFHTAEDLTPHIAWHNFIDKAFAGAAGIEGGGVLGNVIISPEQDVLGKGIAANRVSDLMTMDVNDMSNVMIMPTSIPGNIALPAAPGDVTEEAIRDQADRFVKNLSGKTFKNPKFRMVGPALLAGVAGGEGEAPSDQTIDTTLELLRDAAFDEAGYQAISMPLVRAGVSMTAAGAAATFVQEALRTGEAQAQERDPMERAVYEEELQAAAREGQYAPDATASTPSGETVTLPRVEFFPPIGKAEGEAQMVLEEQFAEPDVFEGSPRDVQERRTAEMERIATEDTAMQTDETPGFVARR